ncbi:MAG TPA: acyltransferase family protein [Steroidobacteraceae bacterium]|nr:acyltransferase family protein [Steroidobacteraceae bacterium]
MNTVPRQESRFHSLDAVRAAALLAGIVLHATMSYLPGFAAMHWPIADQSTSVVLGLTFFVIHIFRMALFFLIAGFFARMLHQRLGTGGLMRNRLRRIGLPLVAAVFLVLPFTFAAIVWAAVQIGARGGPPPGAAAPVIGPMVPWGHLWFLYLLLVLFALWLPLRWLVARLDASGARRAALARLLARVLASRIAPPLLALPVAIALVSAPWWMIWMGVPVPAVGLVPNLPALLTFGIAFVLGWAFHREQAALRTLAADWLLYLAGAVLATLASLYAAGDRVHFGPEPLPATERAVFAGAYSIALWCWCFAAIGAAVRFLDEPSPRWRYLSDASYWMYLMHLPIVWLLQAWSFRWPLHWAVKFPVVLAVTMVVLLASYHWLVRSTFVGVFLNGRRYPRAGVAAADARLAT